ncbi:Csu type fimbrial protein [Silvimonas iriomotensis]|uniref:Polyketide synthase n=1 Tax=Silvimonas iriomotensis TaxID=449662 RepID=A0ABQ2PCB8_9NEIS|nr:spore coat U domain-containing protein [Silvimonas iriomotensis]GGP23150.1 polyketide synthase [Silvimonas iriomotensis]
MLGACTVLTLALSGIAMGGTTTGQVNSTMTLTAACQVNGSTTSTGVNFGSLNFGSQTTLFSTASAQVNGGSGAIAVQCSPGSGATLTFQAGLHDAQVTGGGRAMANGAGKFIPYDIYSDAGYSTVLASGSSVNITEDGTTQTVNIYGRAVGVAGLTPGTYSDVIAVQLNF